MHDVIIIGSGPAGYAAAIYASRAFLKTCLVTGPQRGGQPSTTTQVENYPGFSKGIMGPVLMSEMKAQAQRFGACLVDDTILNIKYQTTATQDNKEEKNPPFAVTGKNSVYTARSVIIAVGASPKKLGIPSESAFWGKGISVCATCDGFFFRDKDVAVIGGGDTAMEEATYLSKLAKKVIIIHRRSEFRACAFMLEKAKKNPKISFMPDTTVEEFIGKNILTALRVKDVKTGRMTEIPLSGAFLAIGYKPDTEFLKGFVEFDSHGYIKIKMNSEFRIQNSEKALTATSMPGVFAAGDCADSIYRQSVVAAGMGCMAAIDVQRWLESSKTTL